DSRGDWAPRCGAARSRGPRSPRARSVRRSLRPRQPQPRSRRDGPCGQSSNAASSRRVGARAASRHVDPTTSALPATRPLSATTTPSRAGATGAKAGFVTLGSGWFHGTWASSDAEPGPESAAILHCMASTARADGGSRSIPRDRTAFAIGAVVVAIVVGLALLREIVAPGSPGIADGDALISAEGRRGFVGPLGMLVAIVVELVALTALARASDRRGWRPVRFVIAASLPGMAIATGYVRRTARPPHQQRRHHG